MSRIEKALEKAIQMREGIASLPKVDGVEPEALQDGPLARASDITCLREDDARVVSLDVSKVDHHIVCINDQHSLAAEQYKKLRARILSATKDACLNTLMVASSDVGEGKTITAINLAVSLSQEIKQKVLLVDADLRNPSVHRYLGIESANGLSEYLSGKTSLSGALIRCKEMSDLAIMPGGEPPKNPAELLSSDRMRDLVEELKHGCKDRYVIFDSAPMLVAADSLSLSNHVDAILLVVQAGRTLPKAAEEAMSLLNGRTILGVVFNNVPSYLPGARYPGYYRYYRYGSRSDSGRSLSKSGGSLTAD